jgi:hypothetical protein
MPNKFRIKTLMAAVGLAAWGTSMGVLAQPVTSGATAVSPSIFFDQDRFGVWR